MRWGVVVAAGGTVDDELRAATGVERKALARFGDATSLGLTLKAIRETGIAHCVTVTGVDVRDEVVFGEFVPEGTSAIDNARIGVEALGESVDAVLFMPSDTPLLSPEMIAAFVEQVNGRAEGERWYAAGLALADQFRSQYPGLECTPVKLREGRFLSGALYASNPAGLRHALDLLSVMRRSRKSQIAMAWKLGPANLVRYATGRVTLSRAEDIVGRALGGQGILVPDCHPATCLDFDTATEYEHLVRLVRG